MCFSLPLRPELKKTVKYLFDKIKGFDSIFIQLHCKDVTSIVRPHILTTSAGKLKKLCPLNNFV